MKFQIKRVLTPKQVYRAKFAIVFVMLLVSFEYGVSLIKSQNAFEVTDENGDILGSTEPIGQDENGENQYEFNGNNYKSSSVEYYERGKIVYFGSNSEICNASVLIPGTALLPTGFLAIVYGLALIYLFMGIAIISDVFMSGIEAITSQTVTIVIKDQHGDEIGKKKGLLWNSTVANLTLMALGSSAPEIILALLETSLKLDACPGQLGPATIVGSAAFNLLVISGLSIYAVTPENDTDEDRDTEVDQGFKRIFDMGVFSITATSSVFAYIWVFICLQDQNVSVWEAWVTFGFFFILVGLAFGADRYKALQDDKKKLMEGDDGSIQELQVCEWTAIEMYRELVKDKQGEQPQTQEQAVQREEMKKVLKTTMKTDQIDKVDFNELKKNIEGETMLKRIQYRRQVQNNFTGKRPAIAKGEVLKQEHALADHLDEASKNESFGFNCLHYSVSEASGCIKIMILNKKKVAGSIRVYTIDAEAKAGLDYNKIDEVLTFKNGETHKFISIDIIDDDNWEPDEDFFVQLYDTNYRDDLVGQDTRTRVTIIDDDKPGQICFKESKAIAACADDGVAIIHIERKNGSDGIVTVDFATIELDDSEHTATAGRDFEHMRETIIFAQGETEKYVEVKILQRDTEEDQMRNESFAIQLSNITPAGAKLSKKSLIIVNIVTDLDAKKKNDALNQLLQKIEEEEEIAWVQQFINACMLHPTKNEDGEIVDFEPMEGVIHFICIGWKLFFSLVPPPHYANGWGCFVVSLMMIGIVTAIVEKFATLFGCVLNVDPPITAITFVALGTSLPDTFASMTAAQQEKYADAAVGNVTGSNSVNVFLGLGLPWVVAVTYESGKYGHLPDYEGYFVPAGALGFNVVVFCCLAVVCIIFLLLRRKFLGGELGGPNPCRTLSCAFLCSLWVIYVLMCILQMNGVFDPIGIDLTKQYKNNKNITCKYK